MNREIKERGKHLRLVKYLKKDIGGEDVSSEFAGLPIELPTDGAVNDLFVWPWMGILANVDVECKAGVYLDVSSSRLRDDLATKGLNPLGARNEDFSSEGVFGDFLHKNEDFMSVADVES
ncbi:INVOLVED IN DE NOVO 2-like [Olea europaea subsp. europaea]|uniref:INVOLVED IN DE NOVO 2-like n=1 Tax=Olea europaea subsp. europaea TaxID=158383 RepID=A0A8S0V201_OLEEU|nr:INVOLVED IN DE NOVO 2-like [Olea europaea subsp. europaea]